MSDKPEKIEWRELDWCYCGLVGGIKFYIIQRKVYTEPKLHNTVIIEILETGNWWEFDTVKEAKAKAEELLDEWIIRADLAKPSEWISVDDRLPEHLIEVLAYETYIDIPHIAYLFPDGTWVGSTQNYDVSGGPYTDRVVVSDIESKDITHWQPLPSPPTRETP